jgi:hypothetical protein
MAKVQVKPLGVQIAEYLTLLKIVGIRKYIPYLISSCGAHIAHLYNYGFEELSQTFWTQSGKIMDCRLNLLLVGPPGYGKNFIIDNFISEMTGLAFGFVPTLFIGKITDRRFFGGYNERGQWNEGVAQEYANGIVGVKEFNNVLAMGRTDHSPALLENMLEALYGGEVSVGTGDFPVRNYRTYFTLWAGIQSERFSVPSGFPRRVLILNLSPSKAEIKQFSNSYIDGRNIAPDFTTIQKIRDQFVVLHREFGTYIERIKFSNPYTKYLRDELEMTHVEMEIIDKLSAGWTIMHTYKGEPTLNIYLDKPLKALIQNYIDMKHRVLFGVTQSQILKLIDDPIPLTGVKQQCVKLGIEYKKAGETIDQLVLNNILSYETQINAGTNRKVIYVKKGDNWSPSYLME